MAVIAISASAATFPTDDQAIVHVLGRTSFGTRPGDLERVRGMGLQRYIDEQLHPERINDARMNARLDGLVTIGLSSQQIADQYEIPQLEARRQKKAGREGHRRGAAATASSRRMRCSCAPTA